MEEQRPPASKPKISPERAVDPVRLQPDQMVRILLVDDEPKNLTVLETVLDDPNYLLVPASSGEEALLALVGGDFAVLVLDFQMPGMTGFELAHIIKERKKTAQIPIIFLTAYYDDEEHLLQAYGSGAVDYMQKPVNATILRSKVSVFAELYRRSKSLEYANSTLQAEVANRRRAEARLNELNVILEQRVADRNQALLHSQEQLHDDARRKDEFLATLAHELRNPLVPIRNAAQLIRIKGEGRAEVQWASTIIERQVEGMSCIINDLLDVSRLDRGRAQLTPVLIDLAAAVRACTDAFRPSIQARGIEFELQLSGAPISVMADPARFAQVLNNLLDNAAKFTASGGRIEVTAGQDGEGALVVVKDTGMGIAPDQIERIFEKFSQAEPALSRSSAGLGIGLALTKSLVCLHGGTISASSPGLGLGSKFQVRLPLAPGQLQALHDEPQRLSEAPSSESTSLRIVVADDNRDSTATLAVLLNMMGHEIQEAHDGEAAVIAVKDFAAHVVLMDIGMPKLNGYEACRQIRAQTPGRIVTLVALTGRTEPEDKRRAEDAGFDHHLAKPVDLAQLEAFLDSVSRQQPPGASIN